MQQVEVADGRYSSRSRLLGTGQKPEARENRQRNNFQVGIKDVVAGQETCLIEMKTMDPRITPV